jgi:outer membrane protein assembly factor BamA
MKQLDFLLFFAFLVTSSSPCADSLETLQPIVPTTELDTHEEETVQELPFETIFLENREIYEGLTIRSIEITGNHKINEHIIRKQLSSSPGSALKTSDLKDSVRRLEALGYFKRNGIYWKIRKNINKTADLELVINESGSTAYISAGGIHRTDRRYSATPFGFGFTRCLKNGVIEKFECGNATSSLGLLNFSYDWPCVKKTNARSGFEVYYRAKEHLFWSLSYDFPQERIFGASIKGNIFFPEFDRDIKFYGELGAEYSELADTERFKRNRSVQFRSLPRGISSSYSDFFFDRVENLGPLAWARICVTKDTRNHTQNPSEGIYLVATNKIGIPNGNLNEAFIKTDVSGCLYLLVNNEKNLILALRATAGGIYDISGSSKVPYRELYQIGSCDSIRGAHQGYAGPTLMTSNYKKDTYSTPLGALYYTVCNAELRTPISLFSSWDITTKLFYDIGCGFGVDTKDIPSEARPFLKNKAFNPRHTAGVGLSFGATSPLQANFNIGWKLDRNSSFDEEPYLLQSSITATW